MGQEPLQLLIRWYLKNTNCLQGSNWLTVITPISFLILYILHPCLLSLAYQKLGLHLGIEDVKRKTRLATARVQKNNNQLNFLSLGMSKNNSHFHTFLICLVWLKIYWNIHWSVSESLHFIWKLFFPGEGRSHGTSWALIAWRNLINLIDWSQQISPTSRFIHTNHDVVTTVKIAFWKVLKVPVHRLSKFYNCVVFCCCQRLTYFQIRLGGVLH